MLSRQFSINDIENLKFEEEKGLNTNLIALATALPSLATSVPLKQATIISYTVLSALRAPFTPLYPASNKFLCPFWTINSLMSKKIRNDTRVPVVRLQ